MENEAEGLKPTTRANLARHLHLKLPNLSVATLRLACLYCLLTLLLPASADAQNRRSRDTLVLTDGKVLAGRILERAWFYNPAFIKIRPADTRRIQRISATDLDEVILATGPYFRKFRVDLHQRAGSMGVYSRPDSDQPVAADLLLRRIGDGRNDLYFYRYGNAEVFFMEEGNGAEQLKYLTAGDSSDYRTVLARYSVNCETPPAAPQRYSYRAITANYATAEECRTGDAPYVEPAVAPAVRLTLKAGVMQMNFGGNLTVEDEVVDFSLAGAYRPRFDADVSLALKRRAASSLYYVIGASIGQVFAEEDNAGLGKLVAEFPYRALRLGFRYQDRLSDDLGIFLGRSLVLDNIGSQGYNVTEGNDPFRNGFSPNYFYDAPREYYVGLTYRDRFTVEYNVRSARNLAYDAQFSSAFDSGHAFLVSYQF